MTVLLHGGGGCAGSPDADADPALFPAPTEARAVLDAALGRAAVETYRAKYADGTETRVAVELAPLTLLCATNFWASYWHFPTRARLRTEDGRLDVSIGVTIDPGFAQMHYNNLTEVPWAYPPSSVEEQIGHIDVPLMDYAHVGIESWFDLTPEPAGWIKVLGYDDGACGLCDEIGGCIECAFDERVEILNFVHRHPSRQVVAASRGHEPDNKALSSTVTLPPASVACPRVNASRSADLPSAAFGVGARPSAVRSS